MFHFGAVAPCSICCCCFFLFPRFVDGITREGDGGRASEAAAVENRVGVAQHHGCGCYQSPSMSLFSFSSYSCCCSSFNIIVCIYVPFPYFPGISPHFPHFLLLLRLCFPPFPFDFRPLSHSFIHSLSLFVFTHSHSLTSIFYCSSLVLARPVFRPSFTQQKPPI